MVDYIWERLTVSADGTTRLPAGWLARIGFAEGECGAAHTMPWHTNTGASQPYAAVAAGLPAGDIVARDEAYAAAGLATPVDAHAQADGALHLPAELLAHLGVERGEIGILYAYHSDRDGGRGIMLYGEWAIAGCFPDPLWENGKRLDHGTRERLDAEYAIKAWRKMGGGGDDTGHNVGYYDKPMCFTCALEAHEPGAAEPCKGALAGAPRWSRMRDAAIAAAA